MNLAARALVVLVAAALIPPAAQSRPAAERPCTIRGTAGPDALLGTPGNDRIEGGPGIDKLYGGPGDDFLNARDGLADYVNGGPGFDYASREGIDRLVSIER